MAAIVVVILWIWCACLDACSSATEHEGLVMSLIVVATNISALADDSDYKYQVLIGDGTLVGSKTITYGKITGHKRDDGWKVLIQRILDEAT